MTKKEYEILAAFRYELRKYLGFSEQAAHAHHLTPQQYQALLAIQGFPGRGEVTIGELAEQLQIAAHSAVGLVDRLEDAGLIQRQAGRVDRRRVYVKLTANGKTALRKLVAVHHEALQTVGPLLVDLLARVSEGQGGATATVRRRPNASPVCYATDEDF